VSVLEIIGAVAVVDAVISFAVGFAKAWRDDPDPLTGAEIRTGLLLPALVHVATPPSAEGAPLAGQDTEAEHLQPGAPPGGNPAGQSAPIGTVSPSNSA
jgi:hypothetical protein